MTLFDIYYNYSPLFQMPTKWLFAQLFSFRNWWFLDYLLSFAFLSFEESSSMSIFTLMGRKPSSWSPLPQLMYLTMFSSISDAKHRLTTQSVLSWFSCKRSPWHYYKVINQCAIFLLAGLNTDVTPADNKRLPNTENQDLKYVFKKISMIVNLKGSSNGVLFNLAYFVKDIMNAFKE